MATARPPEDPKGVPVSAPGGTERLATLRRLVDRYANALADFSQAGTKSEHAALNAAEVALDAGIVALVEDAQEVTALRAELAALRNERDWYMVRVPAQHRPTESTLEVPAYLVIEALWKQVGTLADTLRALDQVITLGGNGVMKTVQAVTRKALAALSAPPQKESTPND